MRVTFNSTFRTGLANANAASELLARRSLESGSGKKLQAASDNPIAMSTVIAEKSEMATLDQYISATDSTESRLMVVDSILTDIIKQITSAQTRGVSGRSTILTQEQRDAIASEIEGSRDAIMRAVNTQYQGSYPFSGGQSLTPPYASGPPISGYQGDGTVTRVDIARGRSVQSTFDASTMMQGGAAQDLFQTMTDLADAVRSGVMTDIDTAMTELNAGFSRVTTAQGLVGIDLSVIGEDRGRLKELKTASDKRRSTFEDANLAESLSGMAQADQAQQAALQVLSVAGRRSLMDYLK